MALRDSAPMANPSVVFREEFDDWAILFDPSSGEGFGLNPMSAFIWNCLDGKHTLQDILTELRESGCADIPEDAEVRIKAFIDGLVESGLAGYEFHAE